MATSTNYGWAEPDNTSLVKDGAQAIRTLGDAIDTSLWNSGYGQAGKNKIINGDFGIWQRGTSFSAPNSNTFCADRFMSSHNGATAGTNTVSQQTFTAGAAPVAGYESQFFLCWTSTTLGTSQTIADVFQRIENVRTLAGQPATISFWLKSSAAFTPSGFVSQNFGSGGSAQVDTSVTFTGTSSGSWQRFSVSLTVPSVSGKTIGTSSFAEFRLRFPVVAGQTTDIWGLQIEYGSKATPFQTASGNSIQGELAMCQRYYWRNTATQVYAAFFSGTGVNTTSVQGALQLPVTMRVSPSSVDYSTLAIGDNSAAATFTSLALVTNQSSTQQAWITVTGSGFTQYRTFFIYSNNSTSGYIGVSAEL